MSERVSFYRGAHATSLTGPGRRIYWDTYSGAFWTFEHPPEVCKHHPIPNLYLCDCFIKMQFVTPCETVYLSQQT